MSPRRRAALAIAVALALAPPASADDRAAPVDIALVLAVDVSESVDAASYELQHEGIARAFEEERLAAAIAAGPRHAVEVAVMEWSDRDRQVVTVDWTRIAGAAEARDFAARVRASRRSSNGLTAIGDALLAAKALLARAPAPADRRLVDLSGDGMANIGFDVQEVRDALVEAGITINGLAILATEPWLESYYEQYVIGGDGAFLMRAEDFSSFAAAMQQKLLAELSSAPPGNGKGRGVRALARAAAPLTSVAAQMQ